MNRNLKVTLAIIFTITMVGALAAAAVPYEQTGQASQARVQAALVKEVRHELAMLPYYSLFDWLQFEVKPEGVVVLMGQVTRPTLKSDAEKVVKKVEGVEKVVNQIEVLPLSSNDDRIRRNVYRALFNYSSPLFRYSVGAVPSIHIIVKNGNVTLKGVVLSKGDSTIATVQANGVPGVFSVTNELLVENDKPE
ncbi:MAG TPA: BON domain-containing protein [Blastocatellia bacterium]